MFKLLYGSITQQSESKKAIAKKLLHAANDQLEMTTRRIKTLCEHDLVQVAKTGQLKPGSKLHAILILTARNLKLDAGELESLNSMIKSFLD